MHLGETMFNFMCILPRGKQIIPKYCRLYWSPIIKVIPTNMIPNMEQV